MRIISGKFKGKKLFHPTDEKTRPLKDLAKESIFNLIIHSKNINFNFSNSIILDLFSGSGSFGIECLSRGAKFVSFVENYPPVLKILQKNLELISNNNFEIIDKNIFKKDTYNYITKRYDLIFIDPPFIEKKIKEIFLLLDHYKLLKKNGVGIIHRNKNHKERLPQNIKIIDERNYGVSKILFFSLD